MICARLAGIEVFATGGIGGVHRGAETSFDISADLEELAQTPVTVVASGAKAILDLPKTLEVLETRGVPVIAFGQDALPAFWSRDSGLARAAPPRRPRRHRPRPPHARPPRPARRPARRQPDPARGRDPRRGDGPAHRRRPRRGRGRAASPPRRSPPSSSSEIGERTGGAALAANIALVRQQRPPRRPHRHRARRPPGLMRVQGAPQGIRSYSSHKAYEMPCNQLFRHAKRGFTPRRNPVNEKSDAIDPEEGNLQSAIETRNRQRQEAVYLRRTGLKFKEIGAALGVSASVAANRVYTGLRQERWLLDRAAGWPELGPRAMNALCNTLGLPAEDITADLVAQRVSKHGALPASQTSYCQ